jgi:hypothetical protein
MKRTWPGTAHKAVDPDNRLVARSLEREWNEKLAEVEKLEREHTLLPKAAALLLTGEQREQIRRLAHDLPAIWYASTTTFVERKQLMRWLNEVGSRRGAVCRSDSPGKVPLPGSIKNTALFQLPLPEPDGHLSMHRGSPGR